MKNYLILYPKQSKLGVFRTSDLETQTPIGVSKTQTSRKTQTPCLYRKHRPPKKSEHWILENSDPLGLSKTQTPEKLRPVDVSKNLDSKFNIFQILSPTRPRAVSLSLSFAASVQPPPPPPPPGRGRLYTG